MKLTPSLQQLVNGLRQLPGVGPKSAVRMALHLLERNRSGAERLADALRDALERVGHCERCRMLTEQPVCDICSSSSRDPTLLCIVESPSDVHAIEQAGAFRGYYFVLSGRLSPIDGVGPDQLGLDLLERRLAEGDVREVILACSATVEGEATSHYLSGIAATAGVMASRIAQGVPIGGEIEQVDSHTLSLALAGRRQF
jgi:recombination protein RecR